tara:strand:- start:7750 stop:11208 length:3459 start_codon:yes stop_codon:yes gene_type:complete
MLNPSDLYVSGGSNKLLVCWTDKVTKYDSSSFYNFEQDNLPLFDLDERTTLLWEKFGHPTSALTGMSFIVSADAASACSPLHFTTLSACIDALPEVINYPILVEVASFGELGGLNLSNKSFGPNGALEIINRLSSFAPAMNLSGVALTGQEYDAGSTDYKLASAVSPIRLDVQQELAGASGPGLAYDMQQARLFSNGSFVASSSNTWKDERFAEFKPYIFSKKVIPEQLNRLTASLSSAITPWDITAASISEVQSFKFTPFDKASSDAVFDVSTVNELNNTEIKWGDGTEVATGEGANNTAAAAFAYFNKLDFIKVNNCNGPVFIRNFNVDGENLVDRGIEIKNSNVNLERCSVSRCNDSGLFVDNSEVNILRGFIGYRNYSNISSNRVGVPFSEKRESYDSLSGYGAGIRVYNSTLNLKSTYDRDILQASATLDSNVYPSYSVSAGNIPAPSVEALYCLSRNDIGIDAVNSLITGGRTEQSGKSPDFGSSKRNDGSQIFAELNTEAGLRLSNSKLDYSGRIYFDGNYKGVESRNSKVYTDQLNSRFNQNTAIDLENSELVYNKDLYAAASQSQAGSVTSTLESQVGCILNGQDLVADNSIIKPYYTSSMPQMFGMFYTSGCFGLEESGIELKPCIHLKNNSDADLIHAHMVRVPGTSKTLTAHHGLISKVESNSTLTVRGSGQHATAANGYANVFLGPKEREDSINVAGLYAKDNSTIKIQGPTTIGRFGVDVLAEDSSNIEITPHKDGEGALLVSSFDLSNPANHTMVELHSTRSCLVANRNSRIVMENLGDHKAFYNTGIYGQSQDGLTGFSDSELLTYASAGFVQFYPNANVNNADVVDNPTVVQNNDRFVFENDAVSPCKHYLLHNYANSIDDITTGGMCVRAVGNSFVETNNVHFPATWHNASGIVYDIDGTAPLAGNNCTRLFIWNIADNSMLKASQLSVSGSHPRDSGYNGPSGVWGSASGAPTDTPDTSSLSVLDYYGHSSENPFGKSVSAENFGAFRLYFSVDPVTNFMVANGSNQLQGMARQVFSQGYNFSGDLIVSSTGSLDSSSQYASILRRSNLDIVPSGFYYASAMMAGSDTIKAVLDDSALNTFANAKHNMVGKSGLAKVVEGYYDNNSFGGDSFNSYTYGDGLASVNNFNLEKDN